MYEDTEFESQIKRLKTVIDMSSAMRELSPRNHIQDAIERKIGEMATYIIDKSFSTQDNKQIYTYYNREEPIYERLSLGEVLIISKDKSGLLVAENNDGVVSTRRVSLQENS